MYRLVYPIAAIALFACTGGAAADKYECMGQTCMNITTMDVKSGVLTCKLKNLQNNSLMDIRIDCNNGTSTLIEGDDVLNGPFFPNSLSARLCAAFGGGGV